MGQDKAGTIMSERRRRHLAFARLLSSAVVSQAVISAANFSIGLLLIRRTMDAEYGYYVLASSVVLLLVSLQNAFFNPPLAIRINQLDSIGRSQLVGGLYREQRKLLTAMGSIATAVVAALWYLDVLTQHSVLLALATLAAALSILNREYFRMVLFAHRRPGDVLRTDLFYVVLMVSGVYVATLTTLPAVVTMALLSMSAVVSGILLSQALLRHEPWDSRGSQGILKEISPLGLWSTFGAATHWAFSQGYIYLVASTLDVAAVAAIAATRLLMMPMNLLATGIGSLMLPLASGWLQQYGAPLLWRRLCLLAMGLAIVTLCYFGTLWLLRDWVFLDILKKQFAQRDELLMLWGIIFLVMVIRSQIIYLLAAQGRFRALTLLTLMSALIALIASYFGIRQFGVPGALMGMLTGELINLVGIVVLSFRRIPLSLAEAA